MTRVVWNQLDLIEALAALPAESPIAERLVIVPTARAAQAFRQACFRSDKNTLGAGTRSVLGSSLALELLHAEGIQAQAGEERRRPIRIRRLIEDGIELEHYPLELLREAPGWDVALARAIGDLEGAGLEPEDLPTDSPIWRDLASLWTATAAAAGSSWTKSKIFEAAAELLETTPQAAPALAIVSGFETAVEARFLRALAGEHLALCGARPLRTSFLDRIEQLYGADARRSLATARPPEHGKRERDLLARYLFSAPQKLTDPQRPRSHGRDGSFDIVEYDGLEDEVEAAAQWAGRQVLDRERPLGDTAILVPHLDPWTGLVADRLARLELPVYVAGGLPLARQSAGARVLAVVTALVEHLRIDRFAEILPSLQTAGDNRVAAGAARDLAYRLGTVGGSPSDPGRALEWSVRMEVRAEQLSELLEDARLRQERGDEIAIQRLRNLERLHRDLISLIPATRAVVGVAEQIVNDAELPIIAASLSAMLVETLRLPVDAAPVLTLVTEALDALASDDALAELRGQDAIEIIERALSRIRVSTGRFGAPAVYVGTLKSAEGLRFGAVRILGLVEGRFPSATPEDPVLSGPMRELLRNRGVAIETAGERVLSELHRLVQLIGNVDDCVVLSTSRLGEERSVREPSAALIEAATAVGRAGATVVDTQALRRDYVTPALVEERGALAETPLSESAWLAWAAVGKGPLPERWRSDGSLDLQRIHSLHTEGGGALAGLLDPEALPDSALPGLSAARPLSSYRVRKILECPHRFLFEDLLYFREPTTPPKLRDIDAVHYGGLLHLVVERFYNTYGQAFCQHDGELDLWLERGDGVAESVFADFCEEYPLVGDAVKEQQLDRIRRDMREYLEYDWRTSESRAYEGVEVAFGFPDPVELEIAGRPLFVRGYIDRIDLERGVTLIRDLKSGKPHPRFGAESEPDYRLDLQLALYGLVTRELAETWNVPRRIAAAYVYPRGRGDLERAFYEDWHVLEAKAREWMTLALDILEDRTFARTPDRADCTFCAFRSVCSVADIEESRALMSQSTGPLKELHELKGSPT